MARTKKQCKPNGHAGEHGRTNGHAPAFAVLGGALLQRDGVAPDVASSASAAIVASAATVAATECEAGAEMAPPRANGSSSGAPSASPKNHDDNAEDKIPPGEWPLPENPADFVEEIHSRVDLFEVWQSLLKSTDMKIRQRAIEKLTELRYKGAAALNDEPQPIVIDIDSAVARRAAEGANQ